MLLVFGLSASLSTFRIPESEIYLPAGTELHFRLTQPLHIESQFSLPVSTLEGTTQQPLTELVRSIPFRTVTQATNVESDLTNLVFLGSRDAVERAFDAAGWSQTDARNARSYYGTMRSIVENQGYREAPMSVLLLDGAAVDESRDLSAVLLGECFAADAVQHFDNHRRLSGGFLRAWLQVICF